MKNSSFCRPALPAGRLIKTFALSLTLCSATLVGRVQVKNEKIQRTEEKYRQLFLQQITESKTDPELLTILQRLIFGDTFFVGKMDDKTRELLTITALATNQTLPQLKTHTNAALNVGATPIEIPEVIYQCAPFIGFPKVLNAMDTVNAVFIKRGISLPLDKKGTITYEQRFEKGKEMQMPLYGDGMIKVMQPLPKEFAEAIPRILTESCFGDFYTRDGLSVKTRELVILCALTTLGGTERQLSSHAVGNLKAGNNMEAMMTAMVQIHPYIGFPRIANAIFTIREAKAP